MQTSEVQKRANKPPASADLLLLPLLSVFTIAVLWALLSAASHWLFRAGDSETGCLILNDPSTGVRGIPNCTCWKKAAESGWAEYRFNNCGHRANMACGAPKNGAYRIVLIGSSFGFGMWVAQTDSFAEILPAELTASAGRRVELYNQSMQWGFPKSALLRLTEALAEHPDLILWDLTPEDIRSSAFVLDGPNGPDTAGKGDLQKLENSSRDYATTIFLRRMLYWSRTTYVASYLAGPDLEQGFLKRTFSPQWRAFLSQFDQDAAGIEEQANRARVPVVAVLLPNRAQAAMIASGEWAPQYDPFHLDRELQRIVDSHGGKYVSILADYSNLPSPERQYFPVDGHPDENGHRTIARLLAQHLSSGSIPELKARGRSALAPVGAN